MTLRYSSRAAKELVLQFVLDSIEQKKKSQYLQEIISLGKKENVWMRLLNEFFQAGSYFEQTRKFSMN
jgi:hypothetical protein